MSTLRVNAIQNTSGVEQYLAKAFVNFNGTGTVAIRAAGNVSSITDNGTGDYTVNFTNAMADANYSVAGMAGPNGVNSYVSCVTSYPYNTAPSYLTTSVRIGVGTVNGGNPAQGTAPFDSNYVHLAIFR